MRDSRTFRLFPFLAHGGACAAATRTSTPQRAENNHKDGNLFSIPIFLAFCAGKCPKNQGVSAILKCFCFPFVPHLCCLRLVVFRNTVSSGTIAQACMGWFPRQMCGQQGRCSQGRNWNVGVPSPYCRLGSPHPGTTLQCGQGEGETLSEMSVCGNDFLKPVFSKVATLQLFLQGRARTYLLTKVPLLLCNMVFFLKTCIFTPYKSQKCFKLQIYMTVCFGSGDS